MLSAIFGMSAVLAAIGSYLICKEENNLTLNNLVSTFVMMFIVITLVIMGIGMAL